MFHLPEATRNYYFQECFHYQPQRPTHPAEFLLFIYFNIQGNVPLTTFNWITSNNSINLNTLIRIVNHSSTFKIKLIKFPFLFRPDNSSLDHHLSNLSLTSIRSPNTTAIDRLQPEIIVNPSSATDLPRSLVRCFSHPPEG